MINKDIDILLRNNTGNKEKYSLIDSFVIRTKIFDNIINEIKLSKLDKPAQNYLIIGQRGAGKTTLLYRLKYAVEDEPLLADKILPVMFSEEQYNLMDLFNLWEGVAEYLEDFPGFEPLPMEISKMSKLDSNEKAAWELLEQRLIENDKVIIVFLENIDVFFKKIGSTGQNRLNTVLKSSNRIRLICSSTTYFEGITDSSDAFFEFFKVVQLVGLSKNESKKLLLKLAEQKNEPQIIQIIEQHPRRLESLRRLTGGNPRIISYLFQIFLDNENGKAILDLYKLLDDITFLYKAELDQLSPQQQKIIDVMARNWDAISTKEVSSKTNIDSKHASSILKTLERNQIIESISTKTKNNLYRLKDRFLNIWYLMRFGRKRDKENVIWLVRFYDTWCDKSELSQRIAAHIDNLKSGKYDVHAALDMGNVFLSCENVSPEVKYSLYQSTKKLLPKELVKELKLSETSLYNSIKGLVKQKDFDKAIEALDEIKSSEKYFSLAEYVYFKKGDFKKVVELLEREYENDESGEVAFRIGHAYELLISDNKNAIKFFELALKQDYWKAAYHLGQIYFYDLDNLALAEKYHRIAIENGEEISIMALATILFSTGELEECEKLVLQAIEKGNIEVKNNLGTIYQRTGRINEAIAMYHEAIDAGVNSALLNLGNLYLSQEEPDFEMAKVYFEKAIELEVSSAYYLTGRLYLKQDLKDKAEEYLIKGVEKKDADSAHLLGHFYCDNDNWPKSEQYFIKSLKLGRVSSLMCLSECAFQIKKNNRKEFILKQFQDRLIEVRQSPLMMLEYARLLLWNNDFNGSSEVLTEIQEGLIGSLEGNKDEDYKENIISELTTYFILLISKGQLVTASSLFSINSLNYKQLLRPIYFALMSYMENDFPNEYLKAGNEMKETISEIMTEIENFKINYN